MSSRSQKQVMHRQKQQRKRTERAKKQKQLVQRANRTAAKQREPSSESTDEWMSRRREFLKQQQKWLSSELPHCGLCGATKNLTKTECCGQWICDDEHTYKLFSFARNSCSRNHRRYTICGYHFTEGHHGRWQECPECRESIEPEMYVHYGTNEYNLEILEELPAYEPTHCSKCGQVIVLADGGYSYSSAGYQFGSCL
ncbi:MAG: hypothetical protein IT427_17455 [Pirellulales bacterium]|nr:hypothetical protein [Pirellulales bacterium]